MKGKASLLGVILIAASCSGNGAPDTTSTSTSTSTTSTSTTTTLPPGPQDLPKSPERATPTALTPNIEWVFRGWIVPISLEFPEGWTYVAGETFVALSTSGPSPAEARLLLINEESDAVISDILDHETTSNATDSAPTTFGNHEAITFEITITGGTLRQQSCAGPILIDDPSHRDRTVALPGCATTRVWIVPLGQQTVVAAIADATSWSLQPDTVPDDLPNPDGIGQAISEFLAAVTIGG